MSVVIIARTKARSCLECQVTVVHCKLYRVGDRCTPCGLPVNGRVLQVTVTPPSPTKNTPMCWVELQTRRARRGRLNQPG